LEFPEGGEQLEKKKNRVMMPLTMHPIWPEKKAAY